MTLLDAYGLIAFLGGGPARTEVRAILREGDAAIATANLVEALDVSARRRGITISRAWDVIDSLGASLLKVELDGGRARRAAEIRSAHYHRKRCAISLGDSILLASAGPEDRIATADSAAIDVATAEGIAVLRLPGHV